MPRSKSDDTSTDIAGWAMGQPGQPGGFPCLPGMIFTYWRPNITIRGTAVPGQPINHATLIAPGGSKLYDVPHRILRRATDDEIAAFNANVSKDPTATSEDPTPAHERSNEHNADCPRDVACVTVGPHAADECVIPEGANATVGRDYATALAAALNDPARARAMAELADRVALQPRDWPEHEHPAFGTAPAGTVAVATAFFKPGGKFYTDEQIDVPPSPFLDFVAAWEAHPRVQHFHRQGFHAVARFDVHPDGFPVMFVGAATPEEVARAVEAADMEGSASTLMRARRAEDSLKAAAEQLTENAGQMTAAAELLERALVSIVASAASDDDAHRLARDIRRLLYGAPSNARA